MFFNKITSKDSSYESTHTVVQIDDPDLLETEVQVLAD